MRTITLALVAGAICCATYMAGAQEHAAQAAGDQVLCTEWKPEPAIGTLDPKYLSESSGIAFSNLPNRLYHINDSGSTPAFYQTDLAGNETRMVKLAGVELLDTEDMTYGPCYTDSRCLFIGDIGLGKGGRKGEVRKILVIKEQERFPGEVTPNQVIPIQFPDDVQVDAESMALHPVSGDLFIISKDYNFKPKFARVSHLFKLPQAGWSQYEAGSPPLEMELVGEFDLIELFPDDYAFVDGRPKWVHRVATGMDFSEDGKKFLVLTYIHALEFDVDLAEAAPSDFGTLKSGADYTVIPIRYQRVQEAITYGRDDSRFLYTSEYQTGDNPVPHGKLYTYKKKGCKKGDAPR